MPDGNSKVIIAASVLSAICSNMFLILPLIAAAAKASLDLTMEETGIIGLSFFGGYFIGSLVGLWAVTTLNWRKLVTKLLIAYIISFIMLGIFSSDFTSLTITLFVSGAISGLMYNVATCTCADQDNADSAFGARLFSEQILAGLLLFSLPIILSGSSNLSLIFFILAGVYFIGFTTIKHMPEQSDKRAIVFSHMPSPPTKIIITKLIAFAVYFASLSGVWAFIEILGQEWGYGDGDITQLLSLGVLGGAAGALLATVQGDRLGLKFPHIISAILMTIILISFLYGDDNLIVSLCVIALPGVWNYLMAYQLGQLSIFDEGGKFAPYFTPMLGLGAAAGPMVGGIVADSFGMNSYLIATVAMIIIGSSIFIFRTPHSSA